VDYIPETSSSIILLSGDSGHGFKMFPIVGSWVTDLLSATDAKQSVARWRWKQPSPNAGKADWGGDVSWRLGQSKEFISILPPKSAKL
jgi:sarcosine oxidase/L-pipecolate oxidase